MPSAADERVADLSFDDNSITVRLKDGRTISAPLAWYPRLFHATVEQRRNWKIAGGGYGIHWPDIKLMTQQQKLFEWFITSDPRQKSPF